MHPLVTASGSVITGNHTLQTQKAREEGDYRLVRPLAGLPHSNHSVREGLLTLAVSTIAAKITAACMLELAFAFGADADHRGHDRSRNARQSG